MAKKKYKSLLATGLAVAGAVQLGTTTPANAAPLKGTITKVSDIIKQKEEKTDHKNGLIEIFSRGDREITQDNNESWYKPVGTVFGEENYRQIRRFTQEDGTPYTGMYMQKNDDNGKPFIWLVLDEDGYYRKDRNKPVFAHMDGKVCADFLEATGVSYNQADGNYYLGHETRKDGALITYMVFDDWAHNGNIWYRSNEKGVAYRNQWFKEPSSGKWYYFDDKCRMVRNQLVDGYWIGPDGVWEG